MKLPHRHSLVALLTILLGLVSASTVSAGIMFVTQLTDTIGEYTTSGATVNASLVSSGLSIPTGIAVSGSDLFVGNVGKPKPHVRVVW